jgi:radical SAM superfamily enzyme YgiQ (UPF0313 family)
MIKLALLSPKGPLYRHKGGIFKKTLRAAPLTLTTLAALIPADLEVDVQLYDEGVEEIPENLDADLIAMTVITGSAIRAYELAAQYRQQGKTVVLGGPHVTLMPEEAAQNADAVVLGYAEESWPQLLRDYAQKKMQKTYRMAADFSLQKEANLVIPRRDLLKKRSYSTINTFEATRGCVHKCDFCVVPSAWGRNPYHKTISHVIDDIRQSKAKRLIFYDLNLIANRSYVRELFEALVPLKIQWFGLATTLIDEEMSELMARSGCRGLLIGFESLSENVLSTSQKRFNRPAEYICLVKRLQSQGILINGTFVFGNDADTTENFDQVRDFVLEAGIELPRFSILTPFPGTPLFKNLEKSDRILTRDWSLYDGQHVVFEPARMTRQELIDGHEKIWKEVYSFKSIFKRNSRQMRARLRGAPLILGANISYRFYANNLSKFYNCTGGVA